MTQNTAKGLRKLRKIAYPLEMQPQNIPIISYKTLNIKQHS